MSHPPKHPDPTPEELLERMDEVKSEWTERERMLREHGRTGVEIRVYVPRCKVPKSLEWES